MEVMTEKERGSGEALEGGRGVGRELPNLEDCSREQEESNLFPGLVPYWQMSLLEYPFVTKMGCFRRVLQ
jgi:hypothetical protein